MLYILAIRYFPLKMECVALLTHLQGHGKEFHYIILYEEKIFALYFNEILLQT